MVVINTQVVSPILLGLGFVQVLNGRIIGRVLRENQDFGQLYEGTMKI